MITKRWMTVSAAVFSLFTLAFSAGCASVNGKWSVAEVDPTAARRDFELTSLTLQKDGTFYAETPQETISGTYEVKDDVLTLQAHDGTHYSYDAQLMEGGDQLRLSRHWRDEKVVATLRRSP